MFNRRTFLLAAALAGCTPGDPGPGPSKSATTPGPSTTTTAPSPSPLGIGPFGLRVPSTVNATVLHNPAGTTALTEATTQYERRYPGAGAIVTAVTAIAPYLGSRFTKIVPDLVQNAGLEPIPLANLSDSLVDLSRFLAAEPIDQDTKTISGSLYADCAAAGEFNGRQLQIPYVLEVNALWCSGRKIAQLGTRLPRTWEELTDYATRLRRDYLFAWDESLAPYYFDLLLTVAAKEAGLAMVTNLDRLTSDSWRNPALRQAAEQLAKLVETQQLREVADALTLWSTETGPVFLPAPASALRAAKDRRSGNFELAVAPTPTISERPKLPLSAAHISPSAAFLVPAAATNQPGGLELLRTVFSREVARQFSLENEAVTVVRGALPTDPPHDLAIQTQLIAGAGLHRISWRFVDYYGLRSAFTAAVVPFLRGEATVDELLTACQGISDQARNNPEYVIFS